MIHKYGSKRVLRPFSQSLTACIHPSYSYARNRHFLTGLLNQIQQPRLQEYREQRIIGYSQHQMHALVSDIDHYNEYVPWCTASRTLYRSPSVSATHTLTAELQVGFQAFSESYISTVTVTSPTSVRAVASDSAMFKTLINEWKFIPISQLHPHASKSSLSSDERSCIVDFYVAFEFRNAIYAQASKLFLDEVSKSMVTAFADRARVVYGSPARASIKLS